MTPRSWKRAIAGRKLAGGLGAGAEWLARRGLIVNAWDVSGVAIASLARRTAAGGW